MDTLDLYGGTTFTSLYQSATALAALSASVSPAVNVKNYDGQMIAVLSAQSATGDETLFVELMTCTSATNSAATQLKNRVYFTSVANTNSALQVKQVPAEDVLRGWIKARFTASAVSVYKVKLGLLGRKKNMSMSG